MKQIYTNITKSILTLAIVLATSAAGFAATIVIASGNTQTYSSTMPGDITIEVHGTLTFSPSNPQGSNTVVVYSGGIVNISKTSLDHVTLDVRSGGVLNLTAGSFTFNGAGIINAGTVNAAGTNLILNSGSALENSGTVSIKAFTINSSSAPGILNKNTGTLNLAGAFTINGNDSYENAAPGNMNVTGAFTNNGHFTSSGNMTVGGSFTNNGDIAGSNNLTVGGSFTNNGDFTSNGTMTVAGTANINAAMTLNGAMTVTGNTTINNAITGTNGSLTVVNGKSTLNGGGKFTGTNMHFSDNNTPGNDFDANWSSTTADNNSYSVGVAPQAGSTLPLRFLSFEAVEYNQFSVYFKFTTTVESSIATLQLQGSIDGKNYSVIETFRPNNMNGIFSYTSAKIESSGYTSYRIAVIDLDGGKEYSKTIFYRSSAVSAAAETSIFPNPVINSAFNVKVTSAEPAIIKIFTNDGRMLSSVTLTGQQQYPVTMPASAARNSLVTIQIIQKGSIKAFTVLNK